jgi:ferric-dicitrate binding protein FerR (iron transport regulator)
VSDPSGLDQETLEALAAHAAGDLTGDERARVEVLLGRSAQARQVLDRLNAVAAVAHGAPAPVLASQARARVGAAVAAAARRRRWRVAWVSAPVLAAAAAAFLLVRPPPSGSEPPGGGEARVVTEMGGYRLLTLDDRGVAFVGEDSEVETRPPAPYSLRLHRGSLRLVIRRGVDPFVIATPAADVEVLGTELDVAVVNGATEVRVVHGQVEVRNQHGHRLLWAREGARVFPGDSPRFFEPLGPFGSR